MVWGIRVQILKGYGYTGPPLKYGISLANLSSGLALPVSFCVPQCRLLWCKWLEAPSAIQLLLLCQDRDGDASENQEQYVSCSAHSTKVSLESAWYVVTRNWPPLNEQQLVCWTRSFGVYRSAYKDAIAQANQMHKVEPNVD